MPTGLVALTRALSPRMVECELTHLTREPIDLARAAAQHAAYEAALRALGCEVRRVAPAPEHPDAVFIDQEAALEKTAVNFNDVCHFTAHGCEIFVDTLVDELLRRGIVVPQSKRAVETPAVETPATKTPEPE